MENKITVSLDKFPLLGAIKADDLIYYDLPILSRYTFNEKNYLYYHVDEEDDINRYLIFKINEIDLFELINGSVSLRDTILNVNDFVYLADIDPDNKILKTVMLYSTSISEDYLPDDDSMLKIEFIEDSYYYKILKKFNGTSHTNRLRKEAFYIKFSSCNQKHGDTLELDELIEDLLPQFTKSYKNYTRADFENNFKEQYTEKKKLSKVFGQINSEIKLRVVDTRYNSFELGLTPDIVMMDKTGDKKVVEWAINIGDNFKEDVLDLDFNNVESLNKIIEKFDSEQRESIFKPIIKLVNNKNVNFQYKEHKEEKYKNIKKIKNESILAILPPKINETQLLEKKEYEFVTIGAVIEKGGSKKTISLSNALTLPLETSTFNLKAENFKKYNYNFEPKEPIPVVIKNHDGQIELTANYGSEIFIVKVEGVNLEVATEKLIKQLFEYVLNIGN